MNVLKTFFTLLIVSCGVLVCTIEPMQAQKTDLSKKKTLPKSLKTHQQKIKSASEAVVNGQNVNHVYYGMDGRKMGAYKQVSEDEWQEVGLVKNKTTGKLKEVMRDEWSVYLENAIHKTYLQLDLHTKKVMFAADAKQKKSPLYEIMNATAKVNGWLVQQVTFGDNQGRKKGQFIKRDKKTWVETSMADGQVKFTFEEMKRDDWSVYLFDKSRNMSIRLNLHNKNVFFATGEEKPAPLYKIVDAQIVKTAVIPKPAKPTHQEGRPNLMMATGRNVNHLDFGRGGKKLGVYRQVGVKSWKEIGSAKGAGTFEFKEMNRDEWSVYLRDEGRNVSVQLDLHTKKVMYSDARNPQPRHLYDISNPSAKINGWLVQQVTFADNSGNVRGQFYREANKGWVETAFGNPKPKFSFTEVNRDDWSVYLFDKSRDAHIQLDLHTKTVYFSTPKLKKYSLYKIVDAKATMIQVTPPYRPDGKPNLNEIVNGQNVNHVDFGRSNKKLGVYKQVGAKVWKEIGSAKNGGTFEFKEKNRDEHSVYLVDERRRVSIQLDLHTKKVMYSDAHNTKMRAIYDVLDASSKVNGWLVREVAFIDKSGRKRGKFLQKDGKGWVETSANGKTAFNFAETQRDDWSVYLYDKTRDARIRLDLHTKNIYYAKGEQKEFPLYKITDVKGMESAPSTTTPTKPTTRSKVGTIKKFEQNKIKSRTKMNNR